MKSNKNRVQVVVVTGPTATGKTALAVKIAKKFNGEIVSADSRQVYRGMNIGSGKDLEEYGDVPYHLIDIANPAKEIYNLGRFCTDAFKAIEDIHNRCQLPIICGGTALYLTAILEGYQLPGGALPPRSLNEPRQRQDRNLPSTFAPPFALEPLIIGVLYPRAEVRERIAIRLEDRLKKGMIDEINNLHDQGVTWETLEFFGLEYREITKFLCNQCDYQTMHSVLLNKIRQFAKRQDIFFRKMERDGLKIHWIERGNLAVSMALVQRFLNGEPLPEITFRLSEHTNGRQF